MTDHPSSQEPTAPANGATDPCTRAVRAGLDADVQHGSVMPPLHLTSTYAYAGFAEPRRYGYTRTANPTRDLLADALAELEGGHGAVVTATGMAAVTLVLQLVGPEELVVAPLDGYGGVHRLLNAWARRGLLRVRFVDLTDPAARRAAFAERPRLVWFETPSNPLLRITDLAAVCGEARRCGALSVVDNTFLSPARQQPLAFGADLVLHSTTKYLNGHSDVVGGAVVSRTPELQQEIAWWANCLGVTGAPFDAFLTLRGLRTLHARLDAHERNAARVVATLLAHPAVRRVHHPSLPDHPGHALAVRQQTGHGGMVSCELAGGEPAVRAFLAGLRCFTLAESLGGVESLICHPATMTHAPLDAAARARAGIGDDLLRLSVGIEAASDLVADLEAALERAAQANPRDARRSA
jgi:cystathionine gamma-synthase